MISQQIHKFAEPVCEEILEGIRQLHIPHIQSTIAQQVTVSIGMCQAKIAKMSIYKHVVN